MKSLIAAVAVALASLPAFAQEVTVFNDSFDAPKTRAEVRAEVMAALARGERLSYGEARPDPVLPFTSRLTRAEVHAEVLAALARGERLSYGEAGPDLLSRRSTATAAALAAVRGAAVAR